MDKKLKKKRRKLLDSEVSIEIPEGIRVRLLRLEKEVDRQRRILNVFASLLPSFIKRMKQHKNGSKKFHKWIKGAEKHLTDDKLIPPFNYNDNPKYSDDEIENLKEFCQESGLCHEDIHNSKHLLGNVINKDEAKRLLKRKDGLGNNPEPINEIFLGGKLIGTIGKNKIK